MRERWREHGGAPVGECLYGSEVTAQLLRSVALEIEPVRHGEGSCVRLRAGNLEQAPCHRGRLHGCPQLRCEPSSLILGEGRLEAVAQQSGTFAAWHRSSSEQYPQSCPRCVVKAGDFAVEPEQYRRVAVRSRLQVGDSRPVIGRNQAVGDRGYRGERAYHVVGCYRRDRGGKAQALPDGCGDFTVERPRNPGDDQMRPAAKGQARGEEEAGI
jgi:hypothetical protein